MTPSTLLPARLRGLPALFLALAALVGLAPREAHAQVMGTCASCSGGPPDQNCGACIANGTMCFDSLAAAERRLAPFSTSDGHDARTLHFAHLVGGVGIAPDFNRAVNGTYNGNNVWNYYGSGAPPGYCASAGGPPSVFTDPTAYQFPSDHRYEDTLDALDCYNGEVDRWYHGVAGHNDGDRVCDGEQAEFNPADGAIFDLGGEGNRVAVFPFTDHGPLPCESFEYSVWLSDDPHATTVADSAHPDPTKWNPSVLIRAFLEGWIPDNPAPADETAALNPDLGNPTQRDGMVQVFSLPCGLTFRYASIVAGNNGNPVPACAFYSFDAELDAVAGLNEDDTAICPDADGDGFRAASCGGGDCNDGDPAVHPGALETCDAHRDLNCDGVVDMCPSGTTCVQGFCAVGCVEGACADGFTCVPADGGATACLPTPCAAMSCPAGQVCGPSGCQDPCAGAMCPVGQVCRGGTCLDPCTGLACPTNQHCALSTTGLGACVPNCPCIACVAPSVCDAPSGTCQSPDCSTIPCPAPGQRDCTGATARCLQPCEGVSCPLGEVCDPAMGFGTCVRDACFGVACPGGEHCTAGMCVADSRMDGGVSHVDSGGTHTDGSGREAGDGGTGTHGHACGCRAVGGGEERRAGALGAAAVAMACAVAARRRRRARRA